ncbi:hypothetical protein [uncultured Limnobacter sp.]|uniref:lysozyme inhibitor LprI family protein n=1 Tax=uncultured Limnobacter sp. TaxID=199681 RepID=UPI0026106FF2|nr:hypothetical protein [uncultured Limnobacter sp.]|tara:strand:+ start:398 stop:1249 length:852 start_codon:yes stop_codon:yes gene_type:complete
MESDRDRYYRLKAQELQDTKSKKSNQETVNTLLYLVGAILTVCLAMVLVSPGVLFMTYLNEWMALELSAWVAWPAAIAFTGALVATVHYRFKKTALTATFYFVLIGICTTAAFYLPPKEGHESVVETTFYLFTPLESWKASAKEKAKIKDEAEVEPSGDAGLPALEPRKAPTINEEPVPQIPLTEPTTTIERVVGAGRPSFDCNKQLRDVEKLICADQFLSSLDMEMAQAYKAALKSGDSVLLTLDQRSWLTLRDQCGDSECLAQVYQSRIAYLKDSTDQNSR